MNSLDITRPHCFSEVRQLDRLLMQQYPSVSDSLCFSLHSHVCMHLSQQPRSSFLHFVHLFKHLSLPFSLHTPCLVSYLPIALSSPHHLPFFSYLILNPSPYFLFTQSHLSQHLPRHLYSPLTPVFPLFFPVLLTPPSLSPVFSVDISLAIL